MLSHPPGTSDPPTKPPGRWAISMRWHDLLFMHWPLKPQVLRPLIPPELQFDTFDGQAWIGIVPFHMNIRQRYAPPLPCLSSFAELNVRTYVSHHGRRGVWFLSLDAANPLAVKMAQWWFHLPYHHARMSVALHGDEVTYRSERSHPRATPATFEARYRPTGKPFLSTAGQLDHWLTERYTLFSADALGHVYRGDIHHAPWQLQTAEADVTASTMLQAAGIEVAQSNPLLHYSRRVDATAWTLKRLTH
jgi:uncharacterized protein YqjF (DUF2071 family)